MSGKFLLDTNIIIGLFGGEGSVAENLAEAREVFVPCIAIGELYYGALKSRKPRENVRQIQDFVMVNVVLGCNAETARLYGDTKNSARRQGRPLPENDMWIAALALQYDLILATRDRHFQQIQGLKTTTWSQNHVV